MISVWKYHTEVRPLDYKEESKPQFSCFYDTHEAMKDIAPGPIGQL